MTVKKFSNALGNIDEKYINEAVTYVQKRKKNIWVKWISVAACLSLVVMCGLFYNLFYSPDTPDVPTNNIMSYFTITAHAANGDSTDLVLAEGCFNSAPPQEGNIFGVDMPIFHFSVRPSNLKNNEAIYNRFDISISYNGISVKGKDEHIQLAYVIPMPNSNESWSYGIMGWFEEPTDILINILDKESHEIIETIILNVKYIPDRQEYMLEMTNLDTKYRKK